jgi:hypothetical protein
LDVAVTVAEPVATDVTKPVALIVAVVAGVMDQLTEGCPVLPSLKVPVAIICTVLLVVPVWMLGVAGPTVIEERVGFTKNPRQLAAKASAIRAAKVAVRRTFWLIEDMLALRLLGSQPRDSCIQTVLDTKIVAERLFCPARITLTEPPQLLTSDRPIPP